MLEIKTKIRFTQPCLGDKPKKIDDKTIFSMPRTPTGQIMFPPQWWRAIVTWGAKVRNGSVSAVKRIEWNPVIDGIAHRWQRYLSDQARPGKRPYAVHEAFITGSIIGVNCVLQDGLDNTEGISKFRLYMEAAGQYRGISPFKPGEWGRFEVVEVGPTDLLAVRLTDHESLVL